MINDALGNLAAGMEEQRYVCRVRVRFHGPSFDKLYTPWNYITRKWKMAPWKIIFPLQTGGFPLPR